MAVEITMPQLSDTMNQGKILNWLKKEGDKVKRGDALAEVETDKANLEIEAFHEGILQKIIIPVGESVEIGTVIAIIAKEGEIVSTDSNEVPGSIERIKASPLAKNIAKSHNVDLNNIQGTGEGGRIMRRDVENNITMTGDTSAASCVPTEPVATDTHAKHTQEQTTERATERQTIKEEKALCCVDASSAQKLPIPKSPSMPPLRSQQGDLHTTACVQPLSKMRATIAQRMVESFTSTPHFYTTAKVVVDALKRARLSLKALPHYDGITYNHLIIKAVALAMNKAPRINSSYSAEGIVQPSSVNIGIITSVPDGLLIPVLKNAQELTLADIVEESKGLVHRARAGKPKPADLVGGTFSVSNMGMYNVEQFSAIINPGQGAILAVSPIQEEAIAENGVVRSGFVMRLTLSADHRIIDGVSCGEFLTEMKRLLEEPILLLA